MEVFIIRVGKEHNPRKNCDVLNVDAFLLNLEYASVNETCECIDEDFIESETQVKRQSHRDFEDQKYLPEYSLSTHCMISSKE